MSANTLLARQFSSLSIFNYRAYFIGQLISVIGTWMQTTAQAWLVLELTSSPFALGLVTMLQFLPITVFTLFGGVLADRLPKRKMLMITQSLALLQASLMGLLVITGVIELWHIYVLALMLGTINALDGPVRQAFVVELVGRDQLTNAVALNSSIFNMARIIGPAVAGMAIAIVGMSMAFFLNAVSFIGVLYAYSIMDSSSFYAVAAKRATGNVLTQVAEGIRYSIKTPAVLFLFILLAFIGTFGYNFSIIIPLVAKFVLNVDAERFGLLFSAMGVGSLISALAIAARGKVSNRVLLGATAVFIVLFAAVAVSSSFWLTAALLMALGAVGVAFSTTINTSLQLIVPDELRGRVMSIFFLLFAGTTPLGGWLTGTFGEMIGVRLTLVIEAGVCGLGLCAALMYRWLHSSAFGEATLRAPAEGSPLVGS